jgi:transcription antitermination factor NusG
MHSGNWYALQVYTGKEKWVAATLEERGHQILLLLYTVVRWWSDRRKRIDQPVFPGYVFCHFDPHRRSPILAAPGVLRIVSSGRTPMPLEDREIEALARIANAGCCVAPVPYLRIGEWVRISGGALDGTIGQVMMFRKGLRVVVSISILERSVSLEVSHERLERLSLNNSRPAPPRQTVPFQDCSSPENDVFLPVKRFTGNPRAVTHFRPSPLHISGDQTLTS